MERWAITGTGPEPENVEVTGQDRWAWGFNTREAELAGHLRRKFPYKVSGFSSPAGVSALADIQCS